MQFNIQPFTADHKGAVQAFNQRIAAGTQALRLPETPEWDRFPPTQPPSLTLRHEPYLVMEGSEVRGGYFLQPQGFWLQQQTQELASYQISISESVVDRRYGLVGVLMLKDALARQPRMFALGMGGRDREVAKLFEAMNWTLVECPFFFRVNRPFRFLRHTQFLRRTASRRLLMDALAFSGAGWLAIRALHAIRGAARRAPSDVTCSPLAKFADAAEAVDAIWEQSKTQCEMIGVRDAGHLDALYADQFRPFQRLMISRRGSAVGWAVLLIKDMVANRHFGELKVGTIVDGLAVPGEERVVAEQATEWLRKEGADLMVTNQLHEVWRDAFETNGYLQGPSNFIFGVSPALHAELAPLEQSAKRIHMTRGDSDGLINF